MNVNILMVTLNFMHTQNDLLNYDLAPADIPLAKDVMEKYK